LTNDDEELALALRLSQLSFDAFDEQVAQLHPGDSEPAWADHTLGATTPRGDGKDDVAPAPDLPLRSPHEQDTGTQPQSTESAPASDEGRQATSSNDNSEPDPEFPPALSQLPADIFDEQVGELDRGREPRTATEDRVASLHTAMSLPEVQISAILIVEWIAESSVRNMREKAACGPRGWAATPRRITIILRL
jgi:hypothetical protein